MAMGPIAYQECQCPFACCLGRFGQDSNQLMPGPSLSRRDGKMEVPGSPLCGDCAQAAHRDYRSNAAPETGEAQVTIPQPVEQRLKATWARSQQIDRDLHLPDA